MITGLCCVLNAGPNRMFVFQPDFLTGFAGKTFLVNRLHQKVRPNINKNKVLSDIFKMNNQSILRMS